MTTEAQNLMLNMIAGIGLLLVSPTLISLGLQRIIPAEVGITAGVILLAIGGFLFWRFAAAA